ncbi:regulatory particle non-ATPase 10 [Striga asiatica]|uniref:Regulatory particle non-ATPase 10 n=1 Tax=Striga asiatica TaxID=4170 RepID=A0A5A7QLV4_STRAF|nr:regulatory particle non-ATPase 10 [Striga asiatica]
MYNFSSLQYSAPLCNFVRHSSFTFNHSSSSSSHTDAATLCELVLDRVADDDPRAFGVSEGYIGGAGDVDVVSAGDEGADPPLDAAVDFDGEADGAGGLVLGEGDAVVGCDGDVVGVDEGGPDVEILVALVHGGDGGGVSDLLVVVVRADGEAVVVDPDAGVRVVRGDGDLECGGDDVRGGDVEDEDGGVLEDESGFSGLEDGPHDEDDKEEQEEEDD